MHHNIQGGSSQSETLSTQDSQLDLIAQKIFLLTIIHLNFLEANLKLGLTGYARKTDSGYDS